VLLVTKLIDKYQYQRHQNQNSVSLTMNLKEQD